MSSSSILNTKTPSKALDNLYQYAIEDLARMIVNKALNDFIRDCEDTSDESPIAYQGWYWRDVDFFTPYGVTIAHGNGQVAVCENNKWGYPQRSLTTSEQVKFLDLVWEAWCESHNGGQLSETKKATNAALRRAGNYIENLYVPDHHA